MGHLRQQPGRVVISVHAPGVGVSGDLGQSAAETQSQISIIIVTVSIQERHYLPHVQHRSRMEWVGGDPGQSCAQRGNSGKRQYRDSFPSKAAQQVVYE